MSVYLFAYFMILSLSSLLTSPASAYASCSFSPKTRSSTIFARHLESSNNNNDTPATFSEFTSQDFTKQKLDALGEDVESLQKFTKALDEKITRIKGLGSDAEYERLLGLRGASRYCLEKALEKTAKPTPEDVARDLCSKIHFSPNSDNIVEEGLLEKASFEAFSAEVSHGPSNSASSEDLTRIPVCSLIMGPSGSGKTFFALLRAADDLIKIKNQALKNRVCTVYCLASELVNHFEKGKFVDFSAACADKVESMLKYDSNKFTGFCNSDQVEPLPMCVHLIIDEAGNKNYEKYFDSISSLESISGCLKRFSKESHVTLCGVRLEVVSMSITSSFLSPRVRMKEWGFESFEQMVKKNEFFGATKEEIIDVVRKFPILKQIATNARAAYFLMRAVAAKIKIYGNSDPRKWVSTLVSQVADQYVTNNGLIDLTPQDRRLVAVGVLRALKNTKKDVPELPEFGMGPRLDLLCFSLINSHLETFDKTLVFAQGQRYSISISPALVLIICYCLFDFITIEMGWYGLEKIAAINAAMSLVASGKFSEVDACGQNDVEIVHLPVPYPGTSSKVNVKVPIACKNKVFLNGDNAPFADVIAPFELTQVKYVEDSNKPAFLNVSHELRKMGVYCVPENSTKSKEPREQSCVLLAGLIQFWNNSWEYNDQVSDGNSQANEKNFSYVELMDSSCTYPASLLECNMPKYLSIPEIIVSKSNETWYYGNNCLNSTKVIEESSMTIVFFTNAAEFELEFDDESPKKQDKDKKKKYRVKKSDVNKEGCLLDTTELKQINKLLQARLLPKKAKILFYFCCGLKWW